MNRLSQTILALALSIGLTVGLELPAIASPRYSHQKRSGSGVVRIYPSRHRDYDYRDYEVDYRRGRNVDYGHSDRYNDYDRYDRGYRRYRGRRYGYDDCDRRYSRVGKRRRHSRYRDSYRNRDYRGDHIRVIRYR